MSQVETSEGLDRARDFVWVAERALHLDPTNKWLQMLAELLCDEVKTSRLVRGDENNEKQKPQRRRSPC
jgi:hypothetical protein